jgi:hypothetical protein
MPAKRKKSPAKRNPVARALRLTKPKVAPKATAYSRKRQSKPGAED